MLSRRPVALLGAAPISRRARRTKQASCANEVYQLAVSGSQATIKGSLDLLDSNTECAFNFFVDGSRIVSHASPKLGSVGLWSYPAGGYPVKIFPNARREKSKIYANGIAISKATTSR
jgi:hypothetical protein